MSLITPADSPALAVMPSGVADSRSAITESSVVAHEPRGAFLLRVLVTLPALLLLCSSGAPDEPSGDRPSSQPGRVERARVAEAVGSLPLGFEVTEPAAG